MTFPVLILHAEDDPDDHLLVTRVLRKSSFDTVVHHVADGEELMDYLRQRGAWTEAPRPALVLLDLNMPRKDGREALREIKTDPDLRGIPVVMLTTSSADADVARSYDLGVNAYVVKPASFEGLAEAIERLATFWFSTVRLPSMVT